MAISALITTPIFIQNTLNGGIDLDTHAMYACLATGGFTPVQALLDYDDLTGTATGVITGATAANPVVISDTSHGLSTGDQIDIASVVGMTELNTNTYKITDIDGNSFSLQDGEGANIDGTGFTAYTSGGTWTQQYEINSYTDYTRQALGSAAIITTGTNSKDRAFDSAIINFGASVTLDAKYLCLFKGTAGSPSGTDLFIGWIDLNYSGGSATSITKANPANVTFTAHGLTNSDTVCIYGSDMKEVTRGVFTITTAGANDFTLGVDLTGALNVGTVGTVVDLTDTTEASSSASNFTVDASATGWFVVG